MQQVSLLLLWQPDIFITYSWFLYMQKCIIHPSYIKAYHRFSVYRLDLVFCIRSSACSSDLIKLSTALSQKQQSVIFCQKNWVRLKPHGSVDHADPTQLLVSRGARNWCSLIQLWRTWEHVGLEIRSSGPPSWNDAAYRTRPPKHTIRWTLLYNRGFLERNTLNLSTLDAVYYGGNVWSADYCSL